MNTSLIILLHGVGSSGDDLLAGGCLEAPVTRL